MIVFFIRSYPIIRNISDLFDTYQVTARWNKQCLWEDDSYITQLYLTNLLRHKGFQKSSLEHRENDEIQQHNNHLQGHLTIIYISRLQDFKEGIIIISAELFTVALLIYTYLWTQAGGSSSRGTKLICSQGFDPIDIQPKVARASFSTRHTTFSINWERHPYYSSRVHL